MPIEFSATLSEYMREAIILLYSVFSRSHPECCIQFWEDFDQLEQIEQRATKRAGAGSHLCSEEGLGEPSLFCLERDHCREPNRNFGTCEGATEKTFAEARVLC